MGQNLAQNFRMFLVEHHVDYHEDQIRMTVQYIWLCGRQCLYSDIWFIFIPQ